MRSVLRVERQKLIQELVQTRRNLKISDLSHMFGVSEMTIHRDIKPLIEQGMVMKTYGGFTLIRPEPGKDVDRDECVYCSRKIDDRLVYRLVLTENRVENACCGHCGLLRHHQLQDEVVQAICFDFFLGTTITASHAWYVMDTLVDIRCCQPQVLTFEHKEYAEGFVQGFGGSVLSFEQAVQHLQSKTTVKNQGCCD
ncbi:HTH-type transcriptional repressor YcnK [Kroppenstedtia guangzhouensis]|uniref:HTH-type transcriptional repressor YcnK n=1 Tax=Kroppenstedtia guangzhouensis TaxID=1274356 RepID=A0ABQ1H3C9_9BACL|nr:DeoR family transcriptional regulator [Kroppenstedtia guangzhouensis]GGA57319.1 HTH-type transcriptional repressor YcnK [Kroppenstedtia guangzhouensis]